jgi:hypothetical protein
VVEDLGLARLGLWDEAVIKNVEDIIADILELLLNLLAVVADGADVLVGALGLLLLLNRRDYAPRGTTSANHILVGNGKQVALIDSQFAANLQESVDKEAVVRSAERRMAQRKTNLSNFLGNVSIYGGRSG